MRWSDGSTGPSGGRPRLKARRELFPPKFSSLVITIWSSASKSPSREPHSVTERICMSGRAVFIAGLRATPLWRMGLLDAVAVLPPALRKLHKSFPSTSQPLPQTLVLQPFFKSSISMSKGNFIYYIASLRSACFENLLYAVVITELDPSPPPPSPIILALTLKRRKTNLLILHHQTSFKTTYSWWWFIK